jgi:hypothetical protein
MRGLYLLPNHRCAIELHPCYNENRDLDSSGTCCPLDAAPPQMEEP